MGDSQAHANTSNELIIIHKEQTQVTDLLQGTYCNRIATGTTQGNAQRI
jgi:hypothetical protein